jgi:UDP-N-acetylmuramate--alanine ligase
VRASQVEVEGFRSAFTVHARGRELGRAAIRLPGRHHVSNALAAVAVGLELDVPFRTIAAALRAFRGVDRRLEARGEVRGALVIDDYGHHPTEIVATLRAVREGFARRTIVVFQPHRFSRTRALLEEFGQAFDLADHVIVTDVYAAGEPPIEGVDGSIVAAALARHGHPSVTYEARLDRLSDRVREEMRPGDVVLTLGAGDVWKVGEELVRPAKGAPRRVRNRRSA